MTTKQKAEMYRQIEKHGENLLRIFPNATERDPVALCKKLQRIEAVAQRLAEDCCNWLSTESDEFIQRHDKAVARVGKLLGDGGPEVWINLDPRGYALKINSADARALRDGGKPLYTDFGGYGIIAPDLTEKGN